MSDFSRMGIWELFDFVLNYPEYIGDSYYRSVAVAINKRFNELRKEHNEQTTTK